MKILAGSRHGEITNSDVGLVLEDVLENRFVNSLALALTVFSLALASALVGLTFFLHCPRLKDLHF